ncbi:MAG: threonylcarbamoyl-AMP synthase [Oscillospiraceae bacterium]|nr:threonylcarbamoyl-AMP synthase [Oscillospiraceae bacterium]
MQTLLLSGAELAAAADILRGGGVLAIPTETVYGLAADGFQPQAVEKIFEAKGRPQDNPLILHIPDPDWLGRCCAEIPDVAYTLAARFWPGPLTLILKRRADVPDVVTGGLGTVGVRCPDHPLARALILRADTPLAAPSANRSGRPSPTTAAHVLEDLGGRIDGVLDGGACSVGVESTILDLTVSPPCLLRPGGVSLEALRDCIGAITVDDAVYRPMEEGEHPRAPGMQYRHYAPVAPVTVVRGPPTRAAGYILAHAPPGAGVIAFDEWAGAFAGYTVRTLGPRADGAAQARGLFAALRAFDHTTVTEIWAMCPDERGVGLAVANRLRKAAGFHIIDAEESV